VDPAILATGNPTNPLVWQTTPHHGPSSCPPLHSGPYAPPPSFPYPHLPPGHFSHSVAQPMTTSCPGASTMFQYPNPPQPYRVNANVNTTLPASVGVGGGHMGVNTGVVGVSEMSPSNSEYSSPSQSPHLPLLRRKPQLQQQSTDSSSDDGEGLLLFLGQLINYKVKMNCIPKENKLRNHNITGYKQSFTGCGSQRRHVVVLNEN